MILTPKPNPKASETEQLLSAHNKNLTGVYVMPDGSFSFDDIDLKQ